MLLYWLLMKLRWCLAAACSHLLYRSSAFSAEMLPSWIVWALQLSIVIFNYSMLVCFIWQLLKYLRFSKPNSVVDSVKYNFFLLFIVFQRWLKIWLLIWFLATLASVLPQESILHFTSWSTTRHSLPPLFFCLFVLHFLHILNWLLGIFEGLACIMNTYVAQFFTHFFFPCDSLPARKPLLHLYQSFCSSYTPLHLSFWNWEHFISRHHAW